MTEYDYSPAAYDRYIETQHRIAKWVDETEQHRPQFQPAVNHAAKRRRPAALQLSPPPPDSLSGSDQSDVPFSAPPAMLYANPSPAHSHYPAPAPPVTAPLHPPAPPPTPVSHLSPPSVRQVLYPNSPPYYGYMPAPVPTKHHHHHRSSHSIRHPHPSPPYYTVPPAQQVSPSYPHPHQQYLYPQHSANPAPGYLVMRPPQVPQHKPVVYLRA